MRYPPALLDEIRARLPVSSVAGRRVKLKKQGREFSGLSPFKHEKTPSFTVNDQKGFYHCFATGEHGDIFKFLMKVDGFSFPEAVEQLANEAGVELPKPTPQAEAREAQAVTLRKIMEDSCRYFEASLSGSQGYDARAYLERRGLSSEVIERFRLGYAPPGRHQLKEHLATRGFRPEDMAESGMLISGNDIPVSYDRFRNRLMFPITDMRGEIIAFGGRALAHEQQPKYLNSPETPLFHKGSVLFNAAAARKAARESGQIIVAEGYMDVIAFHRAGFENAVAPLGTALTEAQLKMLWRLAEEPLLCFDGDSAGVKAAHRSIETALPLLAPGKSLNFVFLSDGLDPDDLLRQRGRDAVAQALTKRETLIDGLWNKEVSAAEWRTPEKRAELEGRLKDLIATIADPLVRKHYDMTIRNRLWQHFSQRKNRKGEAGTPEVRTSGLADANARRLNDAILLKMILDHEDAIEQYYEEISGYDFEDEDFNILKRRILEIYPIRDTPIRQELARDPASHTALSRIDALVAPLKVLVRDEKQEQIVNNLKTFFEAQKAYQNDARIRLAIMEAAEHGDEDEWLSSVPALMGTNGNETPRIDDGGARELEKSNFDDMVKIAMKRVAKVNGQHR
ncbi:MAG: DNA primase [Hyphomicrobiales bacterium]|nr:DNA primase [Hyphomicrobiales bacterium]